MWDFHHLRKVRSTYLRHFVYAMYFNLLAVLIVITGVIHALLPWLFPLTPYHLARAITRGTEEHFLHHAELG
jgi:hypothetical protein